MYRYLVYLPSGSNLKKIAKMELAKKAFSAQRIITLLELDKKHTVLELGSGSGIIAKVIAPKIRHLHCADISESFLREAQRLCKKNSNISYHRITPGNFDFLDAKSLDAVYAVDVFVMFNLYEIFNYLKELHRVLIPGGMICFNIADSRFFKKGPPPIFLRFLETYRKNKGLGDFIQWNSIDAVVAIASHIGYSYIPFDSKFLLFRKNLRARKVISQKA